MPTEIENEYNKETEENVNFYTAAYYVFDNFSAHAIDIWGRKFPTSEHAYQWKKFESTNLRVGEKILNATSPLNAKKIADNNKEYIHSGFSEIKVGVMEEVLRAKVAQHDEVREILLKSGEKNIIENSPVDSFWGVGLDGKGGNMLGKLWVKVKSEINI